MVSDKAEGVADEDDDLLPPCETIGRIDEAIGTKESDCEADNPIDDAPGDEALLEIPDEGNGPGRLAEKETTPGVLGTLVYPDDIDAKFPEFAKIALEMESVEEAGDGECKTEEGKRVAESLERWRLPGEIRAETLCCVGGGTANPSLFVLLIVELPKDEDREIVDGGPTFP